MLNWLIQLIETVLVILHFNECTCVSLTPIKISIDDAKLTEIHEMISFEVLVLSKIKYLYDFGHSQQWRVRVLSFSLWSSASILPTLELHGVWYLMNKIDEKFVFAEEFNENYCLISVTPIWSTYSHIHSIGRTI